MLTSKKTRDRLFTAAVCLGFVIVQTDISIVNVGLGALSQNYHAGVADLEWVINTYSLLFAALLLGAGTLGDRFGVRNVFITGIMIFICASVCCAFAPSIYWLYAARAIQGVGAALLVPSSLTLLRQYFADVKARTRALAAWAASGSVSLAAGPVVGGFLIKLLGWKSIFLVNVPVGLLSLMLMLWFAPASPRYYRKINIIGQALIMVALGTLTFSLSEAGRFGWSSWLILGTCVTGLATMGLFIFSERTSQSPVLMPSVLKNSLIVSGLTIGFICTLVFYGSVFIFSLFFQRQLNQSAMQTGLSFLPMMLFNSFVNINSSRLIRHFSVRFLSVAGSLVSFSGFGLLLFISPHWTLWQLFIPMMLLGGGTNLAVPGIANLMFSEVSDEEASSSSALFSCARQMGGVAGIAIFGVILSYTGESYLIPGLKIICITAMIMTLIWLLISRVRLPG